MLVSSFIPMFSVQIEHEFFAGGICPGLSLVPLERYATNLARTGGIVRSYSGAITVSTATNRECYQGVASFMLLNENADFPWVTALPQQRDHRTLVFRPSREDPSQLVSTQLPLYPSRFDLDLGLACANQRVDIHWLDGSCVFTGVCSAVGVLHGALPRDVGGLFELSCANGMRFPLMIDSEVYQVQPTAVVVLEAAPYLPKKGRKIDKKFKTLKGPIKLRLSFQARETLWRYLFLFKEGYKFDDKYKIVDRQPQAGKVSSQNKIHGSRSLTRFEFRTGRPTELADGTQALEISSRIDSPIKLLQAPPYNFSLDSPNTKNVIRRLPFPSSPWPRSQGSPDHFYSDIYVTL